MFIEQKMFNGFPEEQVKEFSFFGVDVNNEWLEDTAKRLEIEQMRYGTVKGTDYLNKFKAVVEYCKYCDEFDGAIGYETADWYGIFKCLNNIEESNHEEEQIEAFNEAVSFQLDLWENVEDAKKFVWMSMLSNLQEVIRLGNVDDATAMIDDIKVTIGADLKKSRGEA